MSAAELARRGAELARNLKHAPAAQLPPVGPVPAPEVLVVGALLWGRHDSNPGEVLALVADDDIEDLTLAEVLQVARSLTYSGDRVGLVAVADELRRSGRLTKPVAERLNAAATCGAVPEALPVYACATVAASLRRRAESAGTALIAASESMAEADLAPLAERAAARIVDCAARLAKLRGEC